MIEKERKITAPEGCEIEKVEIVDGVAVVTFREKERKLPKSWEEFCEMTGVKIPYNLDQRLKDVVNDNAVTEAMLALLKLIQLRDCYNGDWVPDWNKDDENKYMIVLKKGEPYKMSPFYSVAYSPLYFKTEELCDLFLRNFRPLIENLRPLYGIKEGGEE